MGRGYAERKQQQILTRFHLDFKGVTIVNFLEFLNKIDKTKYLYLRISKNDVDVALPLFLKSTDTNLSSNAFCFGFGIPTSVDISFLKSVLTDVKCGWNFLLSQELLFFDSFEMSGLESVGRDTSASVSGIILEENLLEGNLYEKTT